MRVLALILPLLLLFPMTPAFAKIDMERAAKIYKKLAPKKILVPVFYGYEQVAEVYMTADMRIERAGLDDWITENMDAESRSAFKNSGAWLSLDEGFYGLAYDAAEGVLRLHPDPARMKNINIGLRDAPSAVDIVLPAKASAFLNFRGGQEYLHEGAGETGRQPLRLDLDGAVNVENWVLEGRGGYFEDDASREWRRGDVRMVHDFPDRMLRLAAGDLSYPVTSFQSYQPMLGVSLARNFSLQPYRITTPSGETSFVLSSASSVDIFVNGRKIRSLRLDPGTYDVSDFPVAEGGNDVALVITDGAGNVETKSFSLLGDQALLKKGLHEYAYNFGIESRTEDGRKVYDGGRPSLSLFHRFGFSDTATAGISAQGDVAVRQTGVFALKAFPVGNIGAEAAVSHMNHYGGGSAVRTTFRRLNARKSSEFSALAGWRSAGFAALGQTAQPVNPAAFETAARYSRTVMESLGVGIGGRYRFGRGEFEDDWSYSLNLSKPVTREIFLTVSAEYQHAAGAGVFFSLAWSPVLSRHSVTSSVDSRNGRKEVEWQYRADHDVQSWRMSAGLAHENGEGLQATGSAAYNGYRAEASLRHDIVTGADNDETRSRSQLFFGTALVYAGGQAALSRPVTDSFILLTPHKALAGQKIGVNPAAYGAANDTAYQAEADGLGAAVLPGNTSYMYRSVKIDARNLPVGYDIGRDFYMVMPSYKSGTLLTVGNAANIYADGYLVFMDGRPASFLGGVIRKLDDEKPVKQEFFTNAAGRFRITRLEPGAYEIILGNLQNAPVHIDIPEQPAGRFDAGTIFIPENKA